MYRQNHKPKVLLVNPWIVDFKAFDLWLKPMGLLYLSSILKANGINTKLIDCMDRNHPSVIGSKKIRSNKTGKFYAEEIEKPAVYREIPRKYKRYGIPVAAFKEELENAGEPDLIMVTSIMTYWFPGVLEAIAMLKKRFPRTPVMLGGVYSILCGDHALTHTGAHIVVSTSDIKHIMEKIGAVLEMPLEFIPKDFSSFPAPDFQQYPKLDYLATDTSLGCPFRCTYCCCGILQPYFVQKPAVKVAEEILKLSSDFNIRQWAFYDDALLVNSDTHFVPLMEKIIESGEKFHFHTPNGLHAKYIDKKNAGLMKQAGFETIRISLESSAPATLKETGNKLVVNDFINAVNNLKNAGYRNEAIGAYIIMGIPGQKKDEVEETIRFVNSLNLHSRLSNFSPVPGTPDYRRMLADNPEYQRDPLLHNSAYQYYLGDWLSFEQRRDLRDLASTLNRKL